MSNKEDLYYKEEEHNLEEVADFMDEVAESLRQGRIAFPDDFELDLPEDVVLNIDVDRRTKPDVTSTSIEIELKWKE
ncbi:MAG: amphi-Trp domain-containing protein [Bacteroidetes bacterium]|jgi:amphi-Trp domain-containing protein|nr:amphi-Trp domain-containing protein [Bacteroidota bacterium]